MQNNALWFGTSAPLSGRRPLPPAVWTGIGALAIPLWATWPTLAVWASAIPAFELLTIAFAVGWLLLSVVEERTEASGKAGLLPALACALGLCGADAFFILATASIPVAEANLISYLWPVMVVTFGAALGLFRLGLRHLLGLGLGLAGAAVVIGGGTMAFAWSGVGLALLGGASWAAYCVFRLRQGPDATPVLTPGCGISAILCGVLHLLLERTVLPSWGALAAAIVVGVAPLALANLAWDRGLRRGDGRLLAVMAYATPLASALILIAVGLASPTPGLLAGAGMIIGAGLLCRSNR